MLTKRILLIDVDPVLQEALTDQGALRPEFSLHFCANGKEASIALKDGHYDVALIDIAGSKDEGFSMCQTLYKAGLRCPIIALGCSGWKDARLKGTLVTPNEFLVKPFKVQALLKRVRAVIRHYEISEQANVNIGAYTFRPSENLLKKITNGHQIKLTQKEAAILKYLYRAGSVIVSRGTLLTEVWGYNTSVQTHTLETHVYRLRQKLEQDPIEPQNLVTEPGGYRLVLR